MRIGEQNHNAAIGHWENLTNVKLKQVGGKIPVPTNYVHAQCSVCHHCFMMLSKDHFKGCPNCALQYDCEFCQCRDECEFEEIEDDWSDFE